MSRLPPGAWIPPEAVPRDQPEPVERRALQKAGGQALEESPRPTG